MGTDKQSSVINSVGGDESRAGGIRTRTGRDEPLEECMGFFPSGKNDLEMFVACMKARMMETGSA